MVVIVVISCLLLTSFFSGSESENEDTEVGVAGDGDSENLLDQNGTYL